MSTTEAMDLETALAVVRAHREAQEAQRHEKLLPLIGKFFKFRNSYSGGDDPWWLYAAVTDVERASPMGWSFQRTNSGILELKTAEYLGSVESSDWIEIDADEFWAAAEHFQATVINNLMSP